MRNVKGHEKTKLVHSLYNKTHFKDKNMRRVHRNIYIYIFYLFFPLNVSGTFFVRF